MLKNTILLLFLLFSGTLSGQIITTFAGIDGHRYGGDGGPATDASFDSPCKVAVDGTGNILVADFWNARVRYIDHITGIITTIAGNGNFVNSGDGGPATDAGISFPTDMATDKWGNLYITCDSITNGGTHYYVMQGSFVRKVNTAGIISIIAGNGSAVSGGDGGPATAAGIGQTYGVATDTAGNIFITGESRIRKINTVGVITTLAGNGTPGYNGDGGPATAALIYGAGDLVPDNKGNLYFTDSWRIRKIDKAGIIHTIAGSDTFGYAGDGGAATAARLGYAYGLAIDKAGDLYFSDIRYPVVRKISHTGIITTIGGNGTAGYSGDGGPPDSAEINSVDGVAVDSSGNIYLADDQNENIRMICPTCTGVSVPVAVRQKPELTIRPLPGYGSFSLLLNSEGTEPAMVVVSNLSGEKILETRCIPGKELQINLPVPPGVYVVTCIEGSDKVSKKIVVK